MNGWSIDVSAAASVSGPDGIIELRSKERAIVAALALHHPTPASAATIAPLIWGDELPATAIKAIHNHVSRIRRAIPHLIVTDVTGYRLGDGITVECSGLATSYADLADQPQVAVARARDRRHTLAEEERGILAALQNGSTDALCTIVADMVHRAPHRFVRWWWWAVITSRLGRRQEALEVIRECRTWHRTSGRDSPEQRALTRLESAIVTDDLFIESASALAPESLGAASVPGERSADGRTPGYTLAMSPTGAGDPTGAIAAAITALDADAGSKYLIAPAGGGKTTALRVIVDRMPQLGWSCFTVACSPIEPNPLYPIAHLAAAHRDRFGTDADLIESERRSTGGAPGEHAAALIAQLTTPVRRRCLLVVDDIHHADPAMRDYLAQLAAAVDAGGPHVALVLSSRRTVREIPDVTATLELPPWDRGAITRYLQSYLTPGDWSDQAAEWITERSRGNALYVRELTIDILRRAPEADADAAFVRPAMPDAGSASLHRIEKLGADVMEALTAAAVLGDVFRPSDLSRLVPRSGQSIAIAEARGLVEEVGDDQQQFVHQTFRQAILDTIDPDDQVSLSQRVAGVISDSSDSETRLGELARFARSASSRDPERAIKATIDEAIAARDALRFEEAHAIARLALALIDEHEGPTARWCETATLVGGLGIDIAAQDSVELIVAAGERAIQLGNADIVAEGVWYLCALGLNTEVGYMDAATDRLLTYALDNATTPSVRARACAAGSFSTALAEDPARSRELYFEADAISSRLGDPRVRADVLLRAYTPLSEVGDIPLRRVIAAELHELGDRFDRVEYTYEACRLDLADAIHWGTSDPRSTMERIEAMAARIGQIGRNWSLVAYRAMIALLDGDLDAAERHANVLLTDEVSVGDRLRISTYGAHLISIRMAQGRAGELDGLVGQLASSQPELTIWRAIRALTSAASDPEAARLAFDSVFTPTAHLLPASYSLEPGLVAAAEGVLVLGDLERITTMVTHLTPFEDRWAFFNVGTVGPVDLTLARLHAALGDVDEARRCVQRGLRSTARVGAPLFAAKFADVLLGLEAA